ncbi:hypothetical protein CNMCM8927_004890 [Aspergillus lentulus]|uniref:BTB domain-containing protein n=1 Tax=Aspergillus lentulus TaxID=293939 RepID=A0AAN5YZT8_ASPLE|nr:hypothetical protein CNMCM6069_003564 [Aspergillus lentulus]KAF4209687.1 hypothetical protein CNMCM8927_004890 [Aspergillus lentulus]
MNRPTHIIDPDGEVVIILRNADSPFAEPDEDMVANFVSQPFPEKCNSVQEPTEKIETSMDHMANSVRTSKGGKKKKKGSSVVWTPSEPTPLPVEQSAPEPAEEFALEPTEEWPAEEQPAAEQPVEDPIEIGLDCEQQDESCFRIQVSAKHLMLASSVFKKILNGSWKEGVTYLQKGSVEIDTEGWDIEALLILLRAMHGQHYHIPRKLTLEMLAKVAVVTDYYECKEAICIWTTIWIDALEEKIPSTYSRDLFLWLWISWFFQLPTQFKEATSTAMSQSNGRIHNGLGLPIPDKVMEVMNERRQVGINNLIQFIHDTREALLNGIRGCGFECSSIMYGALSKEMHSNDLLSPRPAAPFPDLNYKYLVWKRHLQSPDSPPFSVRLLKANDDKGNASQSRTKQLLAALPALYRTETDHLVFPSNNVMDYVEKELDLQRLDKIVDWLWVVSRPMPPRLFVLIRRVITHESDFYIAKDKHLLPPDEEFSWQGWMALVEQLRTESIYHRINPRFIYGELRLSRLNKIYRLSQRPFLRGYMSHWHQYGTFFQENFRWLASATIYIAIVLSAMQVGVATKALADNATFQLASYGFAVFAVLGLWRLRA